MRSMLLAFLLFGSATAWAQDREAVRPAGAATHGPYTPGVRTGNLVFASGQLGIASGALVSGGIRAETRQALENLDRVFRAAGTTLARSVKCSVFLTDIADFAAMNEVYVTFFPGDPPARSTVAVAALPLAGAKIEIECTAVVA